VGRTILPQRDLALLAENAFLHQQNAAQNERIEELKNRLKKFENAHTPSSQQGGAGQQPQNEESEQDDESDSSSGPGRNPGHDGTTRPRLRAEGRELAGLVQDTGSSGSGGGHGHRWVLNHSD